MNIKMMPQAAKTLFEDFNHDELQAIREACCEACKGATPELLEQE